MGGMQNNNIMDRQRQEAEEEAVERRKVEEQREREEKESKMKEFYREMDKTSGYYSKQFDPEKKFGTIDPDGYQIYDDTTYKYKAYLPPDYYMK